VDRTVQLVPPKCPLQWHPFLDLRPTVPQEATMAYQRPSVSAKRGRRQMCGWYVWNSLYIFSLLRVLSSGTRPGFHSVDFISASAMCQNPGRPPIFTSGYQRASALAGAHQHSPEVASARQRPPDSARACQCPQRLSVPTTSVSAHNVCQCLPVSARDHRHPSMSAKAHQYLVLPAKRHHLAATSPPPVIQRIPSSPSTPCETRPAPRVS
jgi:hypothetical protein